MTEPVTVDEFIHDTLEDIKSPTQSNFSSKITNVRSTVHSLEDGLEADKTILSKSRKMVKSVVNSGIGYADATLSLCDHLEKLGQFALEPIEGNGSDLAAGLCQFSVIHRDLANMFKHLMQNLNSILVFPMETFLQGDLKSDLKKPFDKSWKEYECKYEKLRKEKSQAMKESGVYIPALYTAEIAEDLEKERRRLQLEVCEYLIKVNEVKSKKGADFLQHFIDFYHAHLHYLKECVCVMEHFGKSMPDLANRISLLQKQHDAQKRRLVDTRENVRRLLEKEPILVNATFPNQPIQMNPNYGTRKSGFLLKKSDGKVKRVWQRRRVCITDTEFCLYHADENKSPVKLMLLTCQLKFPPGISLSTGSVSSDVATGGATAGPHPVNNGSLVPPATALSIADGLEPSAHFSSLAQETKRSFFLVSNNRTYQFQAEDEKDFDEWTNVLSNAMQAMFNQALNGSVDTGYGLSTASGDMCLNEGSYDGCLAQEIGNSPHGTSLYDSQYSQSRVTNRFSRGSSLTGSDGDFLDSPSLQPKNLLRTSDGAVGYDLQSNTISGVSDNGVLGVSKLKGHALHQAIQHIMQKKVPENDTCADCGRKDPEWVSVNLGVLICLECCGTHRELGVQCSRTQSLRMDDLSSNQLLLPRFIGNRLFNEVYESSLVDGIKPKSSDSNSDSNGLQNRRAFIRSKYLERRFITSTTGGTVGPSTRRRSSHERCSAVDGNDYDDCPTNPERADPGRFLRYDLLRAVRTGDIRALLQVHAEGVDLTSHFLPSDDSDVGDSGSTALHIAVETYASGFSANSEDRSNITTASNSSFHASTTYPHTFLPVVEFIIQNSPSASVQRTNKMGDTVLHHASRLGCPDVIRVLLHVGGLPTPMLLQKNSANRTPLDVVKLALASLTSDSTMNSNSLCGLESRLLECSHLLQLAECAQLLCRGEEDKNVLVFSPSATAGADAAAARLQLSEAIDDLSTVQWDVHTSTETDRTPKDAVDGPMKRSNSIHGHQDSLARLIDTSFGSSIVDSPDSESKLVSNILPQSQFQGRFSHSLHVKSQSLLGSTSSKYGSALATLPRKKGPAPRPPLNYRDGRQANVSVPWYSHSTDSSSNDTGDRIEPKVTSLTRRFSAATCESVGHITSSFSSHTQGSPDAASGKSVQSTDHIDVLLDVLEEDPLPPASFINHKDQRSYPATISRISTSCQRASSEDAETLRHNSHSLNQSFALQEEDVSDADVPSCSTPTQRSLPRLLGGEHSLTSETGKGTFAKARAASPSGRETITGLRAVALYDCEAENADELTFRKGEIICVVNSVEPDWWEGYVQGEPQRRGLFPVPYVKILSKDV